MSRSPSGTRRPAPIREDMVEVFVHGGLLVPAEGAWPHSSRRAPAPAAAGEFTRAPSLNGKLDLLQAEATAD